MFKKLLYMACKSIIAQKKQKNYVKWYSRKYSNKRLEIKNINDII